MLKAFAYYNVIKHGFWMRVIAMVQSYSTLKYVQTSVLYTDVNKAKTVSEKMHLLYNILKLLFADLRRPKKKKDFFIPSF